MKNISDDETKLEEFQESDSQDTTGISSTVNEANVESMYVKFGKPYNFEGDMYDGIDLTGLNNLTMRNLNNIEKKFYRLAVTSFNPENTITYSMLVAQEASGLPIEFFEQLPAKDMIIIKRYVVNFLFN